jgi:hypothetical protein
MSLTCDSIYDLKTLLKENNVSKIHYLVFYTGYTSRISKFFGKIKCELENSEIPFDVLVIKDSLWGNGTYYPKDCNKIEADSLCEIIKCDGFIAFKSNEDEDFKIPFIKNITDILSNLSYCAFLNFDNIFDLSLIIHDNKNYLVISYDTESG